MANKTAELLYAKGKYWAKLANHRLGQGLEAEATEYFIRSQCFYEAGNIVEGSLKDDSKTS